MRYVYNKLFIFLLFTLVSCGPSAAPAAKHVLYQVTGTTPNAFVSYNDRDGALVAFVPVVLPWQLEIDMRSTDPDRMPFLSVRNPHTPTSVTCMLTVNGKVLKTDTHQGDNTMAICDLEP